MQNDHSSWLTKLWRLIRRELGWLAPGLGVKRWLLVTLAGTTLIGVGLAILALDVYRTAPDTWWLPVLSVVSLRFLARPVRALIFGAVGLGLILWGIWGMSRALLRPFVRPGTAVVDTMTRYRRRERGPRIAVIGGGHGQASVLRGLKEHTHNLTAIVTVADDGGSSGELRRTLGILPPGDIRNCLAALSNDETMLTKMFQYRFPAGAGLNGHSLGNLLISAMTEITGSFEDAVAESGRVLAVQGRVLPATLHDVTLVAEVQLQNEVTKVQVKGESLIPQMGGKIKRVWLDPGNPSAYPPTMQAILGADVIVVGPGSLYTSILPNLLVPDIAEAVMASRAMKIFVCNVATQVGETDHYSCSDHVCEVEKFLGGMIFDVVLVNSRYQGKLPEGIEWVTIDSELEIQHAIYRGDILDVEHPWRHDSTKLAQVIMDLYYERTGPQTIRESS
jgi:uncharacterized cofD-like protein